MEQSVEKTVEEDSDINTEADSDLATGADSDIDVDVDGNADSDMGKAEMDNGMGCGGDVEDMGLQDEGL